ncbi:MAG: A/G-specific adenine glycosylase [bacterium]|nr:MAG: A/G-specific adenine glycosylase [bacterium]
MEARTMRILTKRRIASFQRIVYDHYERDGRKSLPWRKTRDPYSILVSEVMLQQTQVPRVVGKYREFITNFPDFASLARAPLRSVLSVWSGLGYNRRAKHLHETARIVVREYGGWLPRDFARLITLPGIGKATASAVSAFAFNEPLPFIETNIRAVFIHSFFDGEIGITDAEILPLVEQTLDRSRPRAWYNALMDFGVTLKRLYGNPARRSAHHVKQGRFEGSDRQARGLILRMLLARSMSEGELSKATGLDSSRLGPNLSRLAKEGLIAERRGRYSVR